MLAGAGGIDLVLLVVAADDGVMPQTREHLAICQLLRHPAGVVALTKTRPGRAPTGSSWSRDDVRALLGRHRSSRARRSSPSRR